MASVRIELRLGKRETPPVAKAGGSRRSGEAAKADVGCKAQSEEWLLRID